MKKIGLFGGTFDPPHLGHLAIAECVQKRYQFDTLFFIPTKTPPHKNTTQASAYDRYKMTKLLISGYKNFVANPIELKRGGQSYTVDTIKALKSRAPKDKHYFIIGGDMIQNLPYWHKIDDLYSLVRFIGVTRPGYVVTKTDGANIEMVEFSPLAISSTTIRDCLKHGRSVQGMVSSAVYCYIKEKNLYGAR